MLKRLFLSTVLCVLTLFSLFAWTGNFRTFNIEPKPFQKPMLIIGIVIDQMRWDYLQRFHPLFKAHGGFNRLLNQGAVCNSIYVPYSPSATACGHASIFSGSVPSINGIVGNTWWDRRTQKIIYCTQDDSVTGVGNVSKKNGNMSPRNLYTTTLGDQVRLASNFKSKVFGISLKDRASILPAGNLANAAYWFDHGTGEFITSTYYMDNLPSWLVNFNTKRRVDSFYRLGWKLSLPDKIYDEYCRQPIEPFTKKEFGDDQSTFPYSLDKFINHDYSKFIYTPWGNTLTVQLAEALIIGEKLGTTPNVPDMLTMSFSSPDYIGHDYGSYSRELLDNYIKLDNDLGDFINFLDKKIGKDNYLLFLTADHGVTIIPEYAQEKKLNYTRIDERQIVIELNQMLESQYPHSPATVSLLNDTNNLVINFLNGQIILNNPLIQQMKINRPDIVNSITQKLLQNAYVLNVYDLHDLHTGELPQTFMNKIVNSINFRRGGDMQVVYKPGNSFLPSYYEKGSLVAEHGSIFDDDCHIPLIFYGWDIPTLNLNNYYEMTDIAPTVASLLHIQKPNGAIGRPIREIVDYKIY
ncbi:MAG: alkaline phosphatase family protein [Alphaproteobacteria bacterium]|nr:alkaline phosphatase family protein [Alphaproteobacteria bacterium]